MTNELADLRKTNDRMERRRKRYADYRKRTQPARDRVRRLALLQAGIGRGWLQS